MNFSLQSLYSWYRSTLRNPKYRWWMILGTIVYLISPIDIAPDFLPIVGQLDDVVLLTLLVSEVSQILIDYAKSRKGEIPTASGTVNETSQANNTETVDVNAVPIK